jgi:hypothetical protein
MEALKQKLKRHQSGGVRPANKYTASGQPEAEAEHNFGPAGSMFVKKDSSRVEPVYAATDGFTRKMTKQETPADHPALELHPKLRLRSSLRSSYFLRDARKLRKNIFSNGGEEYTHHQRNQNGQLTDAKTLGGKSNCEIQNKLNQQLDGLS